ncbi:transposase IS66 family protein [Rhodobacter viridis]|uniref:Transposase IS66 family protein n=1 Tax=Rhodobacter viridis TaxID=1054202 RepID=A0A318TS95_9RHOB|nr:transposase IS66 family protein [Rhodobacter viridis]
MSGAYAAPRSPAIPDDGRVDMDSNLAENAIRSPAMNRRNAHPSARSADAGKKNINVDGIAPNPTRRFPS